VLQRFSILLVLLNFVACAIQKPVSPRPAEVQKIRNSDVRWSGDATGLCPKFSGASKRVLTGQSVDFNGLVGALADERRYIAAHAVLSTLTGYVIEPQLGGIDPLTGKALPGTEEALGKFNGLRVDLRADGTVAIPENQRANIARKWKEWLKSTR
jgi:hypothetical protein